MIWNLVKETLEEYFPREDLSFEIRRGDDPSETECELSFKIERGLREQKILIYLENEDNINFLRIIAPLVSVDRCQPEQLIRLLEQNMTWINTSVGVVNRDVVYAAAVPVREFESDAATLGDVIIKVARRADQMGTLLFGREPKRGT